MSWWKPSNPDEIKPGVWMHPAAVLYLESLLEPDMKVVEHGCGGSTLWFAERVKEVHSYDANGAWRDKLGKIKPENVSLENSIPAIDYDLLFIDGKNEDRPKWIKNAHKLLKHGGIVVIDNSNRPHYHKAMKDLGVFCHMPTMIGAFTNSGKYVETAFYRLKGGTDWI